MSELWYLLYIVLSWPFSIIWGFIARAITDATADSKNSWIVATPAFLCIIATVINIVLMFFHANPGSVPHESPLCTPLFLLSLITWFLAPPAASFVSLWLSRNERDHGTIHNRSRLIVAVLIHIAAAPFAGFPHIWAYSECIMRPNFDI
jgi:hypothetical protein